MSRSMETVHVRKTYKKRERRRYAHAKAPHVPPPEDKSSTRTWHRKSTTLAKDGASADATRSSFLARRPTFDAAAPSSVPRAIQEEHEQTHPLSHMWTMYAHHQTDSASYNKSYVKLMDVTTCEEWGQMMQYVPGAGLFAYRNVHIRIGEKDVTGLSFFRDGVTPEWEHPANLGGTTLASRLRLEPCDATALWIDVLCECARGATSDDVVGVHLVQKWHALRRVPVLRLDLWLTSDADVDGVCHANPHFDFVRVRR